MTESGDERELTQLVKDLNDAVVQADVAVLERILHEDYVHNRPNGVVEDRAQYLENRRQRRVAFESLVPDQMDVRVYGDTADIESPRCASVSWNAGMAAIQSDHMLTV